MGQPDPFFVWAKWAWAKKPRAYFWASLVGPAQKGGLMGRPVNPGHF